jgi:hypothetical protein
MAHRLVLPFCGAFVKSESFTKKTKKYCHGPHRCLCFFLLWRVVLMSHRLLLVEWYLRYASGCLFKATFVVGVWGSLYVLQEEDRASYGVVDRK